MIIEPPLIYKSSLLASIFAYTFACVFMFIGIVATITFKELTFIALVFVLLSVVILCASIRSFGACLKLTDHGISQSGVFINKWELSWNQVSEWSLIIGETNHFISLKSSLDHKEYPVDGWFISGGTKGLRRANYAPLVETIGRYCREPKIVLK